ncbi:MAG: NAD(P)/FAD-dependent oxidoreductase [Desulfobacterales bacterium]|nr:NAD(P)/FAD-dependent oxidoreductase [Desulfobacterales bacterium]
MDKIFDVLIIGAGPGGSKAALECIKRGLSVILLDSKKKPGIPVHCGECISEYAFLNTSVKAPDHTISKKVRGVRVTFPGNKTTILKESGFVLNKDKFESWLLEEAINNDVHVALENKVDGLKRMNGIWQISSGKNRYRSKIVIDASGVNSVSNKILKINKPFSYTTGLQYEVKVAKESDIIDFYLWPEYAENGYLWVIPKAESHFNIGLLSTTPKNLEEDLNRFINKTGLNGKVVKKSAGRIPASGPFVNTFSEGLIMIGDAAGFTSPLFEGGTHLALKSACFAAKTAYSVLREGAYVGNYENFWKNNFPPYDKILKGKKKLYSLSGKEMERLGAYLPVDVTNHNIIDKIVTGLKMVIKDPVLIKKGAVDIMRAFENSKSVHYGW